MLPVGTHAEHNKRCGIPAESFHQMAAMTAGGQRLQPCYYGAKRDCSILSPDARLQRPFRPGTASLVCFVKSVQQQNQSVTLLTSLGMSAASLQLHNARKTAPRLALGKETSSDPLRPKRMTQPGQANPQAAAKRSCALKLGAHSEDIYALEGSFAAASAATAHKPHTHVITLRAASDGQKGDYYQYLSFLSPLTEDGTAVRKVGLNP